jgi:hypothetical protein
MQIELLALYGGPDQIMTVTSSLAAILGLLLICWSKLVAVFFRILKSFRRTPKSVAVQPDRKDSPDDAKRTPE